MKRILVIILIVVLIILFIRILSQEDDWICVDNDWIKHGYPSAPKPTTPCGTIDSFEECAAAGYPVMESYPRQCRDAEGNLFVEEIYTEISGIVSLKGELFCPCFLVDDVEVWYDLMEGKPAVDVLNISNGDFVIVKGEFHENEQFWATIILKENAHE